MEDIFLVVLFLLILSDFTATIKQSDIGNSGHQNNKVVLSVWKTHENGHIIFSLTDTDGKIFRNRCTF